MSPAARTALFIIGVWLATRALIAVAFFFLAPQSTGGGIIPTTTDGVTRLGLFDTGWYLGIATNGYDYVPDGKQHSIAFFPLFPSLIWLAMKIGLPGLPAALAINGAAFLAALFVVFDWVAERCDTVAARWTVATMCCCPQSLFGSVGYTEGTYLLLSALALRDFDRARYGRSSLFGALASSARLAGVLLAPAFAIAALVERRGRWAVAVALAPLLGIAVMTTLGALRFGDALAFVHVQAGWRAHLGFTLQPWLDVAHQGLIHRKLQPFVLAAALGAWYGRKRLPAAAIVALAAVAVVVEHYLWSPDTWIVGLLFGGLIAVIAFRERLGLAATLYGVFGVLLILMEGAPISADRQAFGIIPLLIALGLTWQRLPALGYAVLCVMAYDLVDTATRFARGIFVG